ncbi:MAG TPA: hypothetical protein VLK23_17315 [Thermodesulfobacteriota bacterium]|nr:hypothetical protein [Thermodesulfobacteriota bacterium]
MAQKYYREHKISYILKPIFTAHSPLKMGLVRDAEATEEYICMENREMLILHKSQAFGQSITRRAESVLFVGASRQTKRHFLCDLCASAVNTIYFVLS